MSKSWQRQNLRFRKRIRRCSQTEGLLSPPGDPVPPQRASAGERQGKTIMSYFYITTQVSLNPFPHYEAAFHRDLDQIRNTVHRHSFSGCLSQDKYWLSIKKRRIELPSVLSVIFPLNSDHKLIVKRKLWCLASSFGESLITNKKNHSPQTLTLFIPYDQKTPIFSFTIFRDPRNQFPHDSPIHLLSCFDRNFLQRTETTLPFSAFPSRHNV